MQIGWNQLFQQFVSDLFLDTEEKDPPVVTIDALTPNGSGIGTILQSLRKAIDFVRIKYARNIAPAQLPETNHLSVLAEGLAWYFKSALSIPQYEALSAQISAASEHWLKSFMKMSPSSQGVFTGDETKGRNLACRVALHRKYPAYAEKGYQVFLEQGQPIVYYTTAFLKESFHNLGLPESSFRLVENINSLESQLQADKQNNFTPLMILAVAGSGLHDDLLFLHELSKKYDLFMHVEGDDLAQLMTQTPKSIEVASLCDSCSVSPGEWYGLAMKSTCTFLRDGIPSGVLLEKEAMLSLALWLTMQYVGQESLVSILASARNIAKEMYKSLKSNSSIVINSDADSMSVVFRYVPQTKPERLFHVDFFNSLNSQVLIDLRESANPLNLDLTLVDEFNYIQFRPLYSANLRNITSGAVKTFVNDLTQVTSCINATLSCAPLFEETIQNFPGLSCVEVRNFVGIGAIRYLPNFLRGSQLAPEVSQEVDLVNGILARHLNEVDNLFTEGTTTDGRSCVCLGVETKPITQGSPSFYANLIVEMIEKLSLRQQVEEKFGDILRKGIEAAQQHIMLEQELAEQEKGLIRSIPVVGSMFNWLSPVEKKVQGKTFDIGSTSLRNVVFSPRKDAQGIPQSPIPNSPSAKPQGSPPPDSPYRPPASKPSPVPEVQSDPQSPSAQPVADQEVPSMEPLPPAVLQL